MNDDILEFLIEQYEELKEISNNCLFYLDSNCNILFNNIYL